MGFSDYNKFPRCPHAIDDYFHALWLSSPVQSLWSEIMSRQSHILTSLLLISHNTRNHLHFNSIRSYCSTGKIELHYPSCTGSLCEQHTLQQPHRTKSYFRTLPWEPITSFAMYNTCQSLFTTQYAYIHYKTVVICP